MTRASAVFAGLLLTALVAWSGADAQSRLKTMPGYEQYQKVGTKVAAAVKSGAVTPTWSTDSKSFDYALQGKRYHYDVATLTAAEITSATPAATPGRAGAAGVVLARGRGGDASVNSPDGKTRAFTRDLNLYLIPIAGGPEIAVTTDGGPQTRIRNGTATYVYVEELDAGPSVWWSPDGSRIAFLRFDETKAPQYLLALDQTKAISTPLVQAYPHPGEPNPLPDLMVYDVAARTLKRMDVRDGKAFADEIVGHYAWNVAWTKDGAEVLLRRAPRSQKTIELAACQPVTGACRTVVAESWPNSWADVDNPTFLDDGRRFIWQSDRSGFRNLFLYDLTGREIAPLTRHGFDIVAVVKVDEAAGQVWYTARSGDNHMKVQLHRVRLDGRGDVRLTDPAFHHTITIAPDGRHFVDVAQTHQAPPISRLMDDAGRPLAEIARSDANEAGRLGLKPVELFTFKAADGATDLHGMLHFPSTFDPSKSYPLLVQVYAGPGSANGARETYTPPNALTEYGFLVAQFDNRGVAGRGRRLTDALYKNLGVVEIDDQAAGVRALGARPYVDKRRVGFYGTSYGGYASAMILARYPDLVQAAVASSPVTDWALYDSTYPERYLGLPQDNRAVYEQGSVMTHLAGIKGDLMIYYGTADDNVHPKNALTLIRALQTAGKSFEVQVGPDRGHSAVDQQRMMEFFIERLGPGRP